MMHPYRIGLRIQQVDSLPIIQHSSYRQMCSDGLRVSFPSDRQAAMLCNAVSSAQAAFTVGQHHVSQVGWMASIKSGDGRCESGTSRDETEEASGATEPSRLPRLGEKDRDGPASGNTLQ